MFLTMTSFPKFFTLPYLARQEIYKSIAIPDLLDLMLTSKKMNAVLRQVRYPAHQMTVTVKEFFTTVRFENTFFGEFDVHFSDYQYPSSSTTTVYQFNGLSVPAVKDVFGAHSSTKLFGDSHIVVTRELLTFLRSFMPRLEINFVIDTLRDPDNLREVMTLPFEMAKSLETKEWELTREDFQAILERIPAGADLKIESREGFFIDDFSPVVKLNRFELNGVQEWFSSETFLKSDVRHLAVESSTVRLEHVKMFLEKWQSGEFSSTKTVHLAIDMPMQLEVPLPAYQARVHETKRKTFKDEAGEEYSCVGGHDVVRNDGTVATMLIKQLGVLNEFVFFVGEKEATTTKRRREDVFVSDKRRRL